MQHSNTCVQVCVYVCVRMCACQPVNSIFTFAGLSSDVCGVLCGKHSLFAARTLAELAFPLALSQPVLVQGSYLHHLNKGEGQ